MTKPPYAYYVEDEESADIVFAFTDDHARHVGASRLFSESECVTAKRSPEYDEYAALGYVPPMVLLEDGWQLSCRECDKEVDSDFWDYDNDEEINPVEQGRQIFCCAECQAQFNEEMELRRVRRSQVKAVLMSQLPQISDLTIGQTGESLSASFRFPGGQHRVAWESDRPKTFHLYQCDVDAFMKMKQGAIAS